MKTVRPQSIVPYLDTEKSYGQSQDVAEHVEAVRHEGHGVGDVAHDQLHQEEGGRHAEHSQQTTLLARVPTHLHQPPGNKEDHKLIMGLMKRS